MQPKKVLLAGLLLGSALGFIGCQPKMMQEPDAGSGGDVRDLFVAWHEDWENHWPGHRELGIPVGENPVLGFEALTERFDAEAVDVDWSQRLEVAARRALDAEPHLYLGRPISYLARDVECRSTLCRVLILHGIDEDRQSVNYAVGAELLSLLRPGDRFQDDDTTAITLEGTWKGRQARLFSVYLH